MMFNRLSLWPRLRYALLALGVVALAACGGGGSSDVAVVVAPAPVVAGLDIALSRVGPESVRVDWTDDPDVDDFSVSRDGYTLAVGLRSTTLIDASVITDQSYCYQVSGYDRSGQLIALSQRACVTIFP